MMRAAAARGAELLPGRVTAIAQHHGRATGVVVAGEIIEADAVVVAMGPWSILAALSVPLPAIFGLKGHSLVFDTGDTVPGSALFVEYREPSGTVLSPEVFPRTDGTTCLRYFQRGAIAHRSGPSGAGPRGDRAPRSNVRLTIACAELGEDSRAASLLSSDHRRWTAADRVCAGGRRSLRCDWTQRLGHSQRAGYWRGDSGTDYRRVGPYS